MKLKYCLSETEQEIMEVLWECKGTVKTRELFELFNKRGKNWKRQTLNTFLFRLEEMGLISRERSVVHVIGTKADYEQQKSREILDQMYDGDMGKFCMALSGKQEISSEDREELDRLIKKVLQG